MARTPVPYTNLLPNAAVTVPAGTTVDVANDHVIDRADPERTVLLITNTDAAPHTVTLKAGTDRSLSWAAGQGDNTFTVPATGSAFFGPFESGRYLQSGQKVYLDFEAGHAGKVTALYVPRNT
jgi:hypothetical protein